MSAAQIAAPHVTLIDCFSKAITKDALHELDELFLSHPTPTPTTTNKGVRLVTNQKGSLKLPDSQYRCQVIGCQKRKKKKSLPLPQIPEHIHDKKWKNNVYSKEGSVTRCLLCNKTGSYGVIQQHCKQHFLPEYRCLDCGDEWHIKGQWQQHFLLQCPHCPHVAKGETNLKTHIKNLH